MNEKQTNRPQVQSKSKNPGIFSRLILSLIKLGMIGIAAWFVLVVWFLAESIITNSSLALEHANQIILVNLKLIATSSSLWVHQLATAFYDWHERAISILDTSSLLQIAFIQTTLHLLLAVSAINFLRFSLFLTALPLFILVLWICITDGLVKRDIRKFQGARESTLTFHRAKHWFSFCFFVHIFIYLALPLAITPILFFVIQAILLGMTARLSMTYFKKYL